MKLKTKEQYLKEELANDGKLILSLLRFAGAYPGEKEITGIYNMYKKYISPGAPSPCTDCPSSPTSLSNYWVKLGEYYNKNKEIFK